MPRDLDETYERILCSVDKICIEDVHRIRTILFVTNRPLNINELTDAHAVDLSEPPHLDREGRSYSQDNLIDICLGLIEVALIEDDNGQETHRAEIFNVIC